MIVYLYHRYVFQAWDNCIEAELLQHLSPLNRLSHIDQHTDSFLLESFNQIIHNKTIVISLKKKKKNIAIRTLVNVVIW